MEEKPLNVILTGASGMVGDGVLQECLKDARIATILVLTRNSLGVNNPKLKEVVLPNLKFLSIVEDQLKGYSTCFYCLGTTSVGKTEDEYYEVTNTLTVNVAQTLCKLNPHMVFCYISAAGADNTGKGKIMWARVKGKTENDLSELPFDNFYSFRPMLLTPYRGSKKRTAFINIFHGFSLSVEFYFPIHFAR